MSDHLHFSSEGESRRFTVTALSVITVIQAALGLIYWHYWASRPGLEIHEWAYIFSSIGYAALALLAGRSTAIALFAALAMHIYFFVMIDAPPLGPSGYWINGRSLQVPTLILLMWAFWGEINREQYRMGRPQFRPKRPWLYVAILFAAMGALLVLGWVFVDLQSMNGSAPAGMPREIATELAKRMSMAGDGLPTLVRHASIDCIVTGVSAFVLGLCVPTLFAPLKHIGKHSS